MAIAEICRLCPRMDSPPRNPTSSESPAAQTCCEDVLASAHPRCDARSRSRHASLSANARYTATASAYAVAPMPPSSQGLAVVGQASGEGVALHPLARFLHQIGESRQRHELAGGEEVAVGLQPIQWRREPARHSRASATSGFHVGCAVRAMASISGVGAR